MSVKIAVGAYPSPLHHPVTRNLKKYIQGQGAIFIQHGHGPMPMPMGFVKKNLGLLLVINNVC